MPRDTVLLCRDCRDREPGDPPVRLARHVTDFESLLPDRPKVLGALGDGLGDGFGGGVRAFCQGCGAYQRLRLVRR